MNITKRSRELYDKMAKGWNTWDVSSATAQVYLPSGLRLNISFIVPHMAGYSGNTTWEHIETFGEHSVDGSYTEIYIKYLDGLYKVETSAMEKELLIRITPVRDRYNCFVAVEVSGIWGGKFDIRHESNKIIVNKNEETFIISSLNDIVEPVWNPITAHYIICSIDQAVYFTVNSKKGKKEIDPNIQKGKKQWLESTINATGKLGEGLTALRRSLLWNKIYEPHNKRVVTPVTRDWCRLNRDVLFGDYVLFGWDTFFAALQYGLINKELAYSTMFSILEEITPEGMVPNVNSAVGKTRDRSEPQVGSLCAWKLYVQFGDKWFIEECFDRLLEWNRWRFRERDFNGDGLLELASIPAEERKNEEIWNKIEVGKRQGAMWESGIDNSTMWDKAIFNEESHCLELSYVGLNALMVADCELLEKMAVLLGRENERIELKKRRKVLTQKIDSELWSEDNGCYLNKHWNGEFDPCLSLTHFYTFITGIPDEKKIKTMLDNHLLNTNEFWGEYIVPNISKNDSSFKEQEYWRGRIWGPTNFLLGEGLLRIKENTVYDELARKGLDMFIKCWEYKGVVGENYNAITGEAAEKASSDKFYHWGALLVYMSVQRCVNFNQWEDQIEYFDIPDWLCEIKNIPIGNSYKSLR